MTADKPTMQPFRAWVAWHPNEKQRLKRCRWETDIFLDRTAIELESDEIADGWRIVEVEVREVEK